MMESVGAIASLTGIVIFGFDHKSGTSLFFMLSGLILMLAGAYFEV